MYNGLAIIPISWNKTMTIENTKASGLDMMQVKRNRLSEQIAEQIQRNIIEGKLKQGDRLAPERELAEQLGVSRTVIREATKVLQERGLVKVITGSGTYATRIEPAVVSQSIGLFVQGYKHSFRDLLEIRRMLEVEVAGMAAERATNEDIHLLTACLDEMKAVLPEIRTTTEKMEKFVEADLRFHQYLGKASNNSLLPILLLPITDLLLEFRRKASSFPGAPERAISYHQTVLECVCSRDSQRCREAMRNHLSSTEEFLKLMVEEEIKLGDQTPV
jgi:GntR family transcriptional regulator, transcriptional repressor for pyruvate dehydrogenase complex